MTNIEAIKIIKEDALYNPEVAVHVLEVLLKDEQRKNSDACNHCAFLFDREEWEMPCKKCSRNCKDYWRFKGDDET